MEKDKDMQKDEDMEKDKDMQKDEDVEKDKDMRKDEDIKLKAWEESMIALLGNIDDNSFQPFSISVVPDELRKCNEKAYKPKVVSIGPRYKGATRDLQQMEETKWRCMTILLHRTTNPIESLRKCMNAILALDEAVRASYVAEIKLDRYELASIMLNDSCYLLELLISGSMEENVRLKSSHPDWEAGVVRLEEEALTDLILLENQIPLFVLNELAELLFPQVFSTSEGEIIKMTMSLLGFNPDSSFYSNSFTPSHFLEITYSSSFDVESPGSESHEIVIDVEPHYVHRELYRCATRLQDLGITIRSANISGIKFNKERRLLEIPRLDITKTTEAKMHNFIAWEHHKMKAKSYHKNNRNQSGLNYKCKYTGDALFFQGLINSASDVQLLIDKKVIVNHTNMSNEDLVSFFDLITMGVDPRIIDSNYTNIFHLLNTYTPAETPSNFATILPTSTDLLGVFDDVVGLRIRYYFGWCCHYIFAISIISLLTLIQTVYAVLSYHNPKK